MAVDEKNYASILREAFDRTLMGKFGDYVPPPPYITPMGIRHLDALLGGGIISSAPIAISSTPETGKTTMLLQFVANFQITHPNSVVVYLNIEESTGGTKTDKSGEVLQHNIEDRILTFGIDPSRFLHKPIELNIKQIFELLADLTDLKRKMQERTKKEYFILVIWDSIAATPSSKDYSADDPNEVIGFKARELTFNLMKYKSFLSMERITFAIIDQIRSNIQISNPYQQASLEKSTGTFGNYKAATNAASLQHLFRQWLFLSKGAQLKPTDTLGVDGWIMNVFTEKNKVAASQYSVPLIFDKKWGIISILSEYYFLSEKTKTEQKFWPKEKKLIYPMCIESSGNSKVLTVYDPSTGNSLYTSDKFKERSFVQKFNSDTTFRYWFDKAVEISVEQRINVALFRNETIVPEINEATIVPLAPIFESVLAPPELIPVEIEEEPPPVFDPSTINHDGEEAPLYVQEED